MSVVSLERTNGEDLTDAEARAAAQQEWQRSDVAGKPLTGVDLGRMFGRTDRWGRKQIERARQSVDVPTERPTTNGTPATAETPAALLRNAIQLAEEQLATDLVVPPEIPPPASGASTLPRMQA